MAALNLEQVWQLMRNYNFTGANEIAEEMICSLCNKLLINAQNAPCGCRFCFHCISEYLNGEIKSCPCNTVECIGELLSLNENIHIDQPMNRKISRLVVKCPEECCEFRNELRKIGNHIRTCSSQSVSCLYCGIGCRQLTSNENISDHLRSDILTHTKLLMDFVGNLSNEITALKDNNNKLSQKNKLLEDEIKAVKLDGAKRQEKIIELQSKLEEINESAKKKFQNLSSDREKKNIAIEHLHTKFVDLAREVEYLNEEIPALRNVDRNMSDGLDGLKMSVEGNQRTIRAFETNFQQQIEELVLKCQQIKNNEENFEKVINENKLNYEKINLNNTEILLKMEINENELNYREFIWGIDNFSDLMASAKRGTNRVICSESFYSHRNGYKMCLQVFPDGYGIGDGTHLSVFFCLMKGEFDGILQWPFKYPATFEIINQRTRLAHVSKTATCENMNYKQAYIRPKDINKGRGFGKFILLNELLNNADLMINNQIYIKCIFYIRPTNLLN